MLERIIISEKVCIMNKWRLRTKQHRNNENLGRPTWSANGGQQDVPEERCKYRSSAVSPPVCKPAKKGSNN